MMNQPHVMDMGYYFQVVLSLGFVLLLIWVLAWGLKRFGLDKRLRGATGQGGRMQVLDALYLDPKRKLVLVRADTKEYLLLLAGDSATVVDKLSEKVVL